MSEYPNQDQEWLSLQEELNQMAAETPEMSEEFRTGWRQAIRETAQDAPETSQEKPLQEKQKGTALRGIWFRRGLSVAAALVFVLGGTLAGLDLFSRPQPALLSVNMVMDASLESAEEELEGVEEAAEVPPLAARKSEAVEEADTVPVMAESLVYDLEEDLATGAIQEESIHEAATQPQEKRQSSAQEKSPSRMGWGLGLMALSAAGLLCLFFTRKKV